MLGQKRRHKKFRARHFCRFCSDAIYRSLKSRLWIRKRYYCPLYLEPLNTVVTTHQLSTVWNSITFRNRIHAAKTNISLSQRSYYYFLLVFLLSKYDAVTISSYFTSSFKNIAQKRFPYQRSCRPMVKNTFVFHIII